MTLLKFFNRKRDSQRIVAMTNETQSYSPIDQVGITAGEVWHVLGSQGGMSLAKLAKQIDAPRDLVMQAVGWLARENKISIVEEKRTKTVALIPEDQAKAA